MVQQRRGVDLANSVRLKNPIGDIGDQANSLGGGRSQRPAGITVVITSGRRGGDRADGASSAKIASGRATRSGSTGCGEWVDIIVLVGRVRRD
jgi:hypothetical protein